MDYQLLKSVLQTHPTYDTASADELLAYATEQVINETKASLPNEQILSIILSNRAEFTALSTSNQQIVRDILYIGDSVPTAAGSPARDALVSIFGGQSATIQALAAQTSELVSRAVKAGIIETIKTGDVEFARTV